MKIGITGGVGAGKSSVARFFETWGAWRVDADRLAHEALKERGVIDSLCECFGKGILSADGTIVASELASRAFRDPDELTKLTDVVYPVIRRLLDACLMSYDSNEIVVVEAPTLFEAHCAERFDVILTVEAPQDACDARCVASRGWLSGEAARREQFKISETERRAWADHVLENNGSLSDLKKAARQIWDVFQQKNGAGAPVNKRGD